ncbi:MAG: ATP-dependent endonuclease [Vulcanimicrobiota bacterium]
MWISRLAIRNFRNFLAEEFTFKPNVNTLIGENGSGKTNALHALRLLLDSSLPRYAERLEASDFNRALGPWSGHWIIVQIDLAGLDDSDEHALIRHGCGRTEEDDDTGRYTLIFRPSLEKRAELHRLGDKGDLAATAAFMKTITLKDYKTDYFGKGTANFVRDQVYKRIVGDFEKLVFPDPRREDTRRVGASMERTLLSNEVTCTFIKALRDVVADLRKWDNPLVNLLKNCEFVDGDGIIKQVETLNKDISELADVVDLSNDISATLLKAVGRTYAPEVKIESTLPEQLDALLRRLVLKIKDMTGVELLDDVGGLSLGAANLIYLSLKLLEYESNLAKDRSGHFLLIEEPEAHLHTHVQKTLFENYEGHRTQIIVSTHSTHISAASKIRAVNVLSLGKGRASVFYPANKLEEAECSKIERYLDAVRTTLLFAKGVCLVEGDTELIVIPELVKRVFGVRLDEVGVSLIKMDGTVFEHVAKLFHRDRLRRRCSILTDLDTSLLGPLPPPKTGEKKEITRARNAEQRGKSRKAKLEEAFGGNEWVKLCHARYTFEADFALTGDNRSYFESLVGNIYKDPKTKSAVLRQLPDDSKCGKAAVRMAKKAGKGWFAMMLAEKLDNGVETPAYILEGVCFAAASALNESVLADIGRHRAGLAKGDPFSIEEFCQANPTDPLTKVRAYLKPT